MQLERNHPTEELQLLFYGLRFYIIIIYLNFQPVHDPNIRLNLKLFDTPNNRKETQDSQHYRTSSRNKFATEYRHYLPAPEHMHAWMDML